MKDHSRRSAMFTGAAAASLATIGMKAVSVAPPDPIYDLIEKHRKAAAEHVQAVRIEFAYEGHGGKQGERLQECKRLEALTDTAYCAMDEAGCTLVNTPADDAGRYPCALPIHRTAVRRDRSAGPARAYRIRSPI